MLTDPWETLKDAWGTVWHNRYLWVLGFVMALAGSGTQGYNLWLQAPLSSGSTGLTGSRLHTFVQSHWVYVIIAGAVGLVLGILLLAAGVVAQGSAVGAVADLEGGGSGSLRGSIHWGRASFFRFFALVLAYLAVMAAVTVPSLLYWRAWKGTRQTVLPCLGGFALGFGFVLFSILAGIIFELAVRFVVLEGAGVVESVGLALRLFREYFKEVLVCWFYVLLISFMNILALAVVITGILETPLGAVFKAAYNNQSPWLFSLAIGLYFLAWALAAALGALFVATASTFWTLTFLDLEPVAVPGS